MPLNDLKMLPTQVNAITKNKKNFMRFPKQGIRKTEELETQFLLKVVPTKAKLLDAGDNQKALGSQEENGANRE